MRSIVGPLASLAATGVLLVALHRSYRGVGLEPTLLLLGGARDFRLGEQALVLSVVVACSFAIVKRRRDWLMPVQAWSLAAGALLTQIGLGAEVHKVDPRFAFALISGVASLHCCYACLAAYAALAVRRRRA